MIKTFFKIKSILTTAVLMMLCFMGAKSCSEDYFNGNDEAKIAQYEAMLRDNTIVDAFVQDEYTETTVAKAAKIYTYTYNYYIDEVEYSKEITNNVFPPKEVIQLYYSKSNPSLTAEDPKQGIKAESEIKIRRKKQTKL